MLLFQLQKHTFILFMLLAFYSQATNANDTAQESRFTAFQFQQNPATLTRIKTAQQQAIESRKKLLVVLGADWCSDSTAFAKQLSQPSFYQQLTEQYVLVSANAGFFEHGFDITQHFNLPTYYGTPTVLIIEPSTGEVLNRHSFHIWANAANMKPEQYSNYFFNTTHQSSSQRSDTELAEISAFEKELANRVQAGYGVVGPMLAAYVASNKPPSESFLKHWAELGQFRSQVAKDLAQLRTSHDFIQWPIYEPLSWE